MQENRTEQTEIARLASLLGRDRSIDTGGLVAMPQAARDDTLKRCFLDACHLGTPRGSAMLDAELFFIPVVFDTDHDTGNSLLQRFDGAAAVVNALGGSAENEGVRLVGRLFTHEEVGTWTTREMKSVVKALVTGKEGLLPKYRPGNDADEEHIGVMAYLVGIMYSTEGTTLERLYRNWDRAERIIQLSIGMQINDRGNAMQLPRVIGPLPYQEALIVSIQYGLFSVVQGMASRTSGALEVDIEPASASYLVINVSSHEWQSCFHLDYYRLGGDGIDRVMKLVYDRLRPDAQISMVH